MTIFGTKIISAKDFIIELYYHQFQPKTAVRLHLILCQSNQDLRYILELLDAQDLVHFIIALYINQFEYTRKVLMYLNHAHLVESLSSIDHSRYNHFSKSLLSRQYNLNLTNIDCLSRLFNLEILDVSDNNVQTLNFEENTFPKLKTLNLQGTWLSTLPDSLLTLKDSLRELDLRNTFMYQIPIWLLVFSDTCQIFFSKPLDRYFESLKLLALLMQFCYSTDPKQRILPDDLHYLIFEYLQEPELLFTRSLFHQYQKSYRTYFLKPTHPSQKKLKYS